MIMANSTNSSSANGGESLLLTGDNNNSMKKQEQQQQTPAPTPQTTNPVSVETKAEITTVTTITTTTSATLTKSVPQPTHLSNSDSRWIFSLERIEQSPSRVEGVSRESELLQRQEAALFINDLGIKLKVNQLCINTAIIYMHRFFMIHSLKKFHHYVRIVATSCLFFACKVEEQPRRLREFIDIVQSLFHKSNEPINHNSEEYRHYGEQIMALESCLIQTLGFNVLINHAHTVIIKTCQMIKAPRDLAEAAYLTATNSLILTDFCVKFSSDKVACFCIYLACKWTGLIIPMSSEGMQWYEYVNHDIKEQELEDISKEYLAIYGKCSNKIKKKLGITKNQDEINPNLQPHQQGQPQHRRPNPNPSHPQQQQRQNNPNQSGTPSNVNKQQQKPISGNIQQNGFHPQQQQQQQQPNNFHYVNAQHQRQQQQQHYQQQQQHRSNSNPKQSNPVQPGPPNLNKPPSTHYPQQSQPKNPNPSANSTSNRYSYPNGPTSGSSSNTHTSQHNLNSQSGAASSSFASNNMKNNSNTNVNHFNQSNLSNGQQQQVYKKDPPNLNYKQANGNSNSNNNTSNNLNLLNTSNRSSPVNSSMKRGNEEISNNVSTAPNKIPKYVIDQKSAS